MTAPAYGGLPITVTFEGGDAPSRNLTRRRARPQVKQAPAAAMSVLDGNLESSLLLAGHLREQLPGELIAAAPSRDMLAVTGSQVPGGTAALTRCTDAVWQQPGLACSPDRCSSGTGHPGSYSPLPGSHRPFGQLAGKAVTLRKNG